MSKVRYHLERQKEIHIYADEESLPLKSFIIRYIESEWYSMQNKIVKQIALEIVDEFMSFFVTD